MLAGATNIGFLLQEQGVELMGALGRAEEGRAALGTYKMSGHVLTCLGRPSPALGPGSRTQWP